ncbi:MAG: metallophosphoesterase family protein [Anaerolineae bacterium]
MRHLILSDIHANLPALEAVLADANLSRVDRVFCLGDVVGYGPNPNECLEKVRELVDFCVVGNHDWAAIGRTPIVEFNPAALEAARWTQEALTDENREYLEGLPEIVENGEVTLVHGSLRNPVWEYITSTAVAAGTFALQQTPICFHGHTHVPVVIADSETEDEDSDPYSEAPRVTVPSAGQRTSVTGSRFLVNPGSVGQPRDGDPRASYLIYDDEAQHVEHRRVAYPLEKTQEMIRAEGLPESLALRLSYGR